MDDSRKVVVDDPDAKFITQLLSELPELGELPRLYHDDPCPGGVTLVDIARSPTKVFGSKGQPPVMALGSERLQILTAAMRHVRVAIINGGFYATFIDMGWSLAHDDESSEHLAALDLVIHQCVRDDSFSDFIQEF